MAGRGRAARRRTWRISFDAYWRYTGKTAKVSFGSWYEGGNWKGEVLLIVAVSGRSYGAGTANDDVGRQGVAGAEASTAGGTNEGLGDVATVEAERSQ